MLGSFGKAGRPVLPPLRPIAGFPVQCRRRIRAVLTDIDDTLTEHGRLPAIAIDAMERLRAAGMIVVPVTGRPAGWCDLIARQWPVDAVVGENGAFYFRYDDGQRRMIRRYARHPDARKRDRIRLDRIGREIMAEVPGAAISADQAYREADLAIDFREDVPALDAADQARIVGIFERHAATAKVSSIHVNGWFGGHDKLTASLGLLRTEFGIDGATDRDGIVFVGDSPNDAPMFGFFPNAVGVANVMDFADDLPTPPRWLTKGRAARGFVEMADLLLAAGAN